MAGSGKLEHGVLHFAAPRLNIHDVRVIKNGYYYCSPGFVPVTTWD